MSRHTPTRLCRRAHTHTRAHAICFRTFRMEMPAFLRAQRPHVGWPQEACGIRGAAEGPGQVLGLGGREQTCRRPRGPPCTPGPPFKGSRLHSGDCGGGTSAVCGTQRKRFPSTGLQIHTPFPGDLTFRVIDTHSGPHCLWLVGLQRLQSLQASACPPLAPRGLCGAVTSGVDVSGQCCLRMCGVLGVGVCPHPRGAHKFLCLLMKLQTPDPCALCCVEVYLSN